MLLDRDVHYLPSDALDWTKVDSVTIVQGKNLGDAILLVPVVESLLSINKILKINIMAPEACRELLTLDNNVTTFEYKRQFFYQLRCLMPLRRGFSVFLDFHPRLMHRILGRILMFRVVSGLRKKGCSWGSLFDTHSGLKPVARRLRVESYLDVLRRLGLVISFTKPARFQAKELVRSNIVELPRNYVVVHPGSRWMFKSMSPNQWIDLVMLIRERLGYSVVVTGGQAEMEVELGRRLSDLEGVIDLVGETGVNDLANIIKKARGFIGVDTFAAHLAGLLGSRGLVIFGPSDSRIWGPWRCSSLATYEASKLDFACSPCNADGCGGGKVSMCLFDLIPSDIADSFAIQLSRIDLKVD